MPSPGPLMPGSFNSSKSSLDQSLPPKLDVKVGAKSHFYQPPRTPSASTSLVRTTSSTSTNIRGNTPVAGRKRTRYDYSVDEGSTSLSESWSTVDTSAPSFVTRSPGPGSPAPLTNTTYLLRGGMDTPTMERVAAQEREESSHAYMDTMDRRWAGAGRFDSSDLQYFPQTLAPLVDERNGRRRIYPQVTNDNGVGWGKSVINTLGEVVGKVWEFGTSTFKGFYAGGGVGYAMKPPSQGGFDEASVWSDIHEMNDQNDPFSQSRLHSTPIPGTFPEADFIADYLSEDRTSSRPTKHASRDSGDDRRKERWIMVPPAAPTPPTRNYSPARSATRRTPTASSAGRRAHPAKRPLAGASRTSLAGSPALQPNRPASFASPRSPASASKTIHSSPIAVEAQRFAAKRRRQERENEESMTKFNAKLRAMIKEGKEALGSRVEVEDMYVEDEVLVQREEIEDEGIAIEELSGGKRKRGW
ncbi:MAG: hypothetical protein M1824_003557 [Vezdaea acicularis]|nr:MAG: hypothetical protein M1824_003557 [Vezdaea acicularis]